MKNIKERLQEINEQLEALYAEQTELEIELNQERINSIFDSGALHEFIWSATYGANLVPLRKSDYEHSTLASYQKDYHEHLVLGEGVFLYFDDHEVRIVPDSIEVLHKFVCKYGLKTSTKFINTTIEAKLEEVSYYTKIQKILDGRLTCPSCFGIGTTTQYDDGPEETRNICPTCNGSGLKGD